jgi:hypothetical protein
MIDKNSTLLIGCLLMAGDAFPGQAETAVCHLTYGGETRLVAAGPTTTPYLIPTVQVGSFFLFKLVFEQGISLKTYVYADRDEGPQPLHQAIYDYPASRHGEWGVTGRHLVYEPVRDGELEYWCEYK